MPSALVFGATGQLGVAVAGDLLRSGWRVTLVTRDGRLPPTSVTDAGARLIDGTGKTRDSVIRAVDAPIDAVFDPTPYTEADAQDLLAARSFYGALAVVSSCSVYADDQGRSLVEAGQTGFPDFGGAVAEDAATVAAGPQNYATRKVAMEQALLSSGVAATILRPCAIYGKHALHPREWWLLKRSIDGRRAIPVAYGAESRFHTSGVHGIASLAGLCLTSPAARVLNVADPTALTIRQIAESLEAATGCALPLAPFEGPPLGPSHVGSTPWSVEKPFVLDTTRARALGWDGGGDYGAQVRDLCDWILRVARQGEAETRFTRFAQYGYDPFDYAAEDAFLERA